MPRIAIDCRFAALNVGLGRYTRELVRAMVKDRRTVEYVLIVRSTSEEWIPDGVQCIEANIPHYSLREQIELPQVIKATGCDLLFSPHFNIPFFCPVPFVVTIHDLILHRYPNTASLPKQIAYRFLIGHAVKKAQSIIAVSAFTLREIADVYGDDAKRKTQIVLEGVDASYVPASQSEINRVRSDYKLSRPYFLYVGNAKQHKNVRVLIDAFQKARMQDTDLILVSGGPEFESLKPLPPNVRQLQHVADADLPVLYSGALACVTASLYEGFYLPAAEALACGCPVIASNRSAIPEVVQHHGLLIEPTIDALADAFQRPPADRTPFTIGTWDTAARTTEEILLDALHTKRASI
jgi:glycosyltransferase involved in cell wall biosynthesis